MQWNMATETPANFEYDLNWHNHVTVISEKCLVQHYVYSNRHCPIQTHVHTGRFYICIYILVLILTATLFNSASFLFDCVTVLYNTVSILSLIWASRIQNVSALTVTVINIIVMFKMVYLHPPLSCCKFLCYTQPVNFKFTTWHSNTCPSLLPKTTTSNMLRHCTIKYIAYSDCDIAITDILPKIV